MYVLGVPAEPSLPFTALLDNHGAAKSKPKSRATETDRQALVFGTVSTKNSILKIPLKSIGPTAP
jgi:hypothetical protein